MINKVHFSDWLYAILDLFIPRVCLVCGDKLPFRERHICLNCLADMPRTRYSKMPRNRMADRFNDLIQRNLDSVSNSARLSERYSLATALFYYRASTGYRNITKSLKYHGNIRAGRYFAQLLAKELSGSELYSDVDTIVPVPLHWTRRWSRGYNQAEVIGSEIADALGVTLRADILARRRRTKTQTRLSLEEKSANVARAFRLRRSADLSGCSHILLVDDVFTTGATVNACRLALRDNIGADVKISVATLACVGN